MEVKKSCSFENCNKKHYGRGYCLTHYRLVNRDKISEIAKRTYYKHKESRDKRNLQSSKRRWTEAINILGAKCEACGQKHDPASKKNDLRIHHKYYSELDKARLEKYGAPGGYHVEEIRNMAKNGMNPKEKYCVLCHQCNIIEGFVRKDSEKAFDSFGWFLNQGYFDKVLNEHVKDLKKITDYLK